MLLSGAHPCPGDITNCEHSARNGDALCFTRLEHRLGLLFVERGCRDNSVTNWVASPGKGLSTLQKQPVNKVLSQCPKKNSHNLLVQPILKFDAPSDAPEPVMICPQIFFYTRRKGWDLSTTSADQYDNTSWEDAHLLGVADPSAVSIHQQQVVPLHPVSWDYPTSQKSHLQTDEAPFRRQ